MKKSYFFVVLIGIFGLFVCNPLFAQESDPRWERWNKTMVTDSTYVEGSGVLEYYLYRVDASAGETNEMKEASFHWAFIKLLEELDFIVDYNSARIIINNTNLSINVRRLMSRYGANVSVAFTGQNNDGSVRVVINMDTSFLGSRGSNSYDTITFNVYQK